MINCIVIEDQPPAQRILKRFIEDVGGLKLMQTFDDALQAMHYLKGNPVDLIFLDVHLPSISGIEFLKSLKSRPFVILTTAFSEYALESYEYDVTDYLLKPFSFERFVQAVSKVQISSSEPKGQENYLESAISPDVIFIKSGYELVKIVVSDIQYIQSDTDYTDIFTATKKYVSQEPLRHWERQLNSKRFLRIHKSYILNMSKISKIVGNQVHLENKITLPIGRTYREDFMKQLMR